MLSRNAEGKRISARTDSHRQRGAVKASARRPPCPSASKARTRLMSAIRSVKNESTEEELARILRRNGMSGWRRHLTLPGRPDFAFRQDRLAVFVDGCFWHGCPRCYKLPRRNRAYWTYKKQRNRARDRTVTRQLRSLGWKVFRIWEHELRQRGTIVAARLQAARTAAIT